MALHAISFSLLDIFTLITPLIDLVRFSPCTISARQEVYNVVVTMGYSYEHSSLKRIKIKAYNTILKVKTCSDFIEKTPSNIAVWIADIEIWYTVNV